jgi:hypothetical protein
MNKPMYHPLTRDQITMLLAPENAEMEESWDLLTGALHGVIAVLSTTHPRPLYFYEESDRRDLAEQPLRLRGTPFHEIALSNVRAAEEIERMAREDGDAPGIQEIVDQFLDALIAEFNTISHHPDRRPGGSADEENGLAGHRAVAGR